MNGIRIILFAQIGSAKDTFVDIWNEICLEGEMLNKCKLGEDIRLDSDRYIKLLGLPEDEARKFYVNYGEDMRAIFGEDIWNVNLYDKIKNAPSKVNLIIADGRQKHELIYWECRGYIPIGIESKSELREERVLKRDGFNQSDMFESSPELACIKVIDEIKSKNGIVLSNNGTLDEYKDEVQRVYNTVKNIWRR